MHLLGYLGYEFYGKTNIRAEHTEVKEDNLDSGFFLSGYTGKRYCGRCGKLIQDRILKSNRESICTLDSNQTVSFSLTRQYPQIDPNINFSDIVGTDNNTNSYYYSTNEKDKDYCVVFPDTDTPFQILSVDYKKNEEEQTIEIKTENQGFYESKIVGINIPKNLKIEPEAFYNCSNLKIVVFRGTKTEWYNNKYPTNWIVKKPNEIRQLMITIGETTIFINENQYLRIYLADETKLPEYELAPYYTNEQEFVYAECTKTDNEIKITSNVEDMGTSSMLLMYCDFGDTDIIINDDLKFTINNNQVTWKTMEGYPLPEITKGVQLFVYLKDANICYFYPEYPYYQ